MIKIHSNNLIGSTAAPHSNFTLEGSDSYNNYILNLKTQPADWLYRTKEISYLRNEYGHRSVSIDKLSKDFVLFVGCSITFGSGLSLEDTYPYLVSKKLGVDYYNLAVEASGPDVVVNNLFSWARYIKKKPKYIVIQWPEPNRMRNGVELLGPWVYSIKDLYSKESADKFYQAVESGALEHYYQVMKLVTATHIESLNIPFFEVETKDIQLVDVARDLKHPGIETNKNIANLVVTSLTKKTT